MLALCIASMIVFGPLAAIPAIPIAAVFSTAIAMCGHEGSHKSFSKSPFRNALNVYLTFPLFSGLGALYWKWKHDQLHHGHPNVEGVDPDIKPFPFVSSRGDHEKCGRGERWFQRNFQRWAFWPMSLLMSLGMRRSSILFLLRYPKKHGFSRAWFIEAACMTVHYTCWLVIPSIIFGPLIGFAVYSAIWALVGVFLALVFAPAHIGLPIMSEQNHDWLHQLETTRDLELPRVISFFFIGLDYQAEHHLFPKIPHQNLPKAAAITKTWCERHGIEYLSVPYLAALVDSAKFMANAWSRDATDPLEVRFGLVGTENAA
jgi:fatty acid desaturase